MPEKVYFPGQWHQRWEMRVWEYLSPGYYDPSAEIPKEAITHQLREEEVRQLIATLDEAGWIKPRLDERLRTEDLKITHRLLDIIDGITPSRDSSKYGKVD